jgi:hypothetical protein
VWFAVFFMQLQDELKPVAFKIILRIRACHL